MRIDTVEITNFRSISKEVLQMNDTTVLIGRGGAGKSAFLQALDHFYRLDSSLSEDDCHHRDTSTPIEICIRFTDLRDEEMNEFEAYLGDQNELVVIKKYEGLSADVLSCKGRYFARRKQYVGFREARSLRKSEGATKAKEALKQAVDVMKTKRLVDSAFKLPGAWPDCEKWMAKFEHENSSLLEPVMDEAPLMGAPNVGGGTLDKYTEFVYVPAVRDVSSDTDDQKSTFVKLLTATVNREWASNPDVSNLEAELKKKVEDTLPRGKLASPLGTIQSALNEELSTYAPEAQMSLDLSRDAAAQLSMPEILTQVTDGGFTGQIKKKGHGLQRAVLVSLLSFMAKSKIRDRNEDSNEAAPRSPRGALIIAIEEPELYQYPARCRHFANVLRELTKDVELNVQVLYTTHSQYFVSMPHIEQLRFVQRQTNEAGASSTRIVSRTVKELCEFWEKQCGLNTGEVTPESLMARLERPMYGVASEGFFADVVVLVEGFGDKGALIAAAEKGELDLDKDGVTIIPMGSKTLLPAALAVFRAVGIPSYVMFDGDKAQNEGKKPKDKAGCVRDNKSLVRLGGEEPVDTTEFPETSSTPGYTCFQDRLEDYVEEVLTKSVYDELARDTTEELSLYFPRDVFKNADGARLFVKKAYARGLSIPALESAVEAIRGLTTKHPVRS